MSTSCASFHILEPSSLHMTSALQLFVHNCSCTISKPQNLISFRSFKSFILSMSSADDETKKLNTVQRLLAGAMAGTAATVDKNLFCFKIL